MPAAETLSSAEVQKRADSYNTRRTLLGSNPSLYVSKTRLSIRQIPTFVTERMLKRLAGHAIQIFDEEVISGSRTGLSEEEMTRDEPPPDGDKTRNKGKATPRVRQAKIVRQAERVDPLTGKGRSKGYGFLELREHADALRVLRWANNNPEVPSLFAGWLPAEQADKKDADPARVKQITEMKSRGGSTTQPKGSLIVEFSIENAQVVQRRAARQNVVSCVLPASSDQFDAMNTSRMMPRGRGYHPHRRELTGGPRKGEKSLQKGRQSRLSLAHEPGLASGGRGRTQNGRRVGHGSRGTLLGESMST
jgi:nucleolar protein 4